MNVPSVPIISDFQLSLWNNDYLNSMCFYILHNDIEYISFLGTLQRRFIEIVFPSLVLTYLRTNFYGFCLDIT